MYNSIIDGRSKSISQATSVHPRSTERALARKKTIVTAAALPPTAISLYETLTERCAAKDTTGSMPLSTTACSSGPLIFGAITGGQAFAPAARALRRRRALLTGGIDRWPVLALQLSLQRETENTRVGNAQLSLRLEVVLAPKLDSCVYTGHSCA